MGCFAIKKKKNVIFSKFWCQKWIFWLISILERNVYFRIHKGYKLRHFLFSKISVLTPTLKTNYNDDDKRNSESSNNIEIATSCTWSILTWGTAYLIVLYIHSYTSNILRACCSHSEFMILKIGPRPYAKKRSAKDIFSKNCALNISLSVNARVSIG